MSSAPFSPQLHPVLACAQTIDVALEDVAGTDPLYMTTPDKQAALIALTRVESRVAELRLRVLAGAGDIAADVAARDAAAWLAHTARLDGAATRRDLRLAQALDARWHRVAAGLADGRVNRAQAEVVVAALGDLPHALAADVVDRCEARLVELCEEFGPRQLRILGRRVLQVVAPKVAEEAERRALEREEETAMRRTFLTTRRNGDGTTDVRIRLADAVVDRLLTYLDAFTSPRRPGVGAVEADRRPYDQKLGHAFGAFLENADPGWMPLHGGDATHVMVTIDFSELTDALGTALVGDEPITAGEARRLACNASILPVVLGGDSEILDLGRARRLFSPAQRKALALRDVHCRAEGCQIPAAWCEAHHAAQPWVAGGQTDLADGVLLCSWHHHRAHDHRYDHRRHPDGTIRFQRRT